MIVSQIDIKLILNSSNKTLNFIHGQGSDLTLFEEIFLSLFSLLLLFFTFTFFIFFFFFLFLFSFSNQLETFVSIACFEEGLSCLSRVFDVVVGVVGGVIRFLHNNAQPLLVIYMIWFHPPTQ